VGWILPPFFKKNGGGLAIKFFLENIVSLLYIKLFDLSILSFGGHPSNPGMGRAHRANNPRGVAGVVPGVLKYLLLTP
jgi:hypothetical protein